MVSKQGWMFMLAFVVLVCVGQAFANMAPSADFDGDGVVGIPDFLEFVEKFGSRQGDEKYEAKYDLDGNGVIEIPDFLIFVDSFGKSSASPDQSLLVSVCDRTPAVRDSIMAQVDVDNCADVKAEDLLKIESLILYQAGLTELKVDDFSGLSCLIGLSLQDNQLKDLPDGIFDNLPALTAVALMQNEFTTLPTALDGLPDLARLWIWENEITGPMPIERLLKWPKLTRIAFSSNNLTGEIPARLGELKNLEYMNFRDNQLSGEIPEELGNLTNLTYLNLRGNQLSGGIPKELGNLANLTRLELSYNQLSGAIPEELGNLPNLQRLYLHRNGLSGMIPGQLGSLKSLTTLGLNSNQLSGAIPVELGNLMDLRAVTFSANAALTGPLPHSLTRLTNLESLSFQGTELCAPLDAAFQAWLEGIATVSGDNCSE